MFTNEAFEILSLSHCWNMSLKVTAVLQSGLSGAIPSLLHKRHTAQAGRREHSV